MPVKTNLARILKEQGRSNLWLSKQLGKNINTISLYCTGKVSIPLKSLYEIADVLGVTIHQLIPEKMIYVEVEDKAKKKDDYAKLDNKKKVNSDKK